MENYLVTIVVFVIFLGHCSCSCPSGTYGFQCSYKCHCPPGDCNSTSGCAPGTCSPGWSGATCHKHNVALNKTVSSSGDTNYPSSRATDGQISDRGYIGCIETKASNPNWWRVDLVDIMLIHDITIYFRTDYTHRRNGIQVYVTDTTNTPSGHLCYTVTGYENGTDINDNISIPFHGRGRYVLLYTTKPNYVDSKPKMDFCEVEVDVCDPGTFGAGCENYCHCKDGVCDDTTGVCSGGCLPGWEGRNCSTTCGQGMEYGVGCNKLCNARMCQGDRRTCPRDTGRCSDGCQAGWSGEDCATECVDSVEYGVGCVEKCSIRKCQGGTSPCPRDTGRCTGGCQRGWKGEDCTSECIHGMEYGAGCAKNCSTRMCEEESPCSRDTGRCRHGCQAGWGGEDCTSECTLNVNYGPGCYGNCSSRKCKEVSGLCPRDTGRCEGGCQPGWKGAVCTAECATNVNYGPGCHGNCSGRKCKEVLGTCPRDTGRCDGGCQPGWEGEDCILVKRQSTSLSSGNGPVVGGAVAGVVAVTVVAVTVLAVFFYRHRTYTQSFNVRSTLHAKDVVGVSSVLPCP